MSETPAPETHTESTGTPHDAVARPGRALTARLSDPQAFLSARGLGALADRMEIRMTEFTAERAVATMPVLGNTQPIGLLHGGAYVVLGETLGSMHANLHAADGRVAVGIDINATHTGSATAGTVTGVCTPIHLGRSLTVHEIVVTDERGRRCSTVRITNMFRDIAAGSPVLGTPDPSPEGGASGATRDER